MGSAVTRHVDAKRRGRQGDVGAGNMSITVELELPEDAQRFRLPEAVDKRLQSLLDRQDRGISLTQDRGIPLTDEERAEAEGLVELAETLTLLRLRSERLSCGDAAL